MKKFLNLLIKTFPKAEKYITDIKLRTELILKAGLGINASYAIFKLSSGVFYRSVWFGAVGIYYILLCSVKFYLLRKGFSEKPIKNRRKKELMTLRTCGVLLLFLNATMTVIIYYLIHQNKGFPYSDFVTFSAAVYTGFRLIAAFNDILSFKRLHSPVLAASKALSISVALMSLFSLQVTVLDRFGVPSELRASFNLLSGTVIGVSVVLIALTTIVKADRELRKK